MRALVLAVLVALLTVVGVAQPAGAAAPLQLSLKVSAPEFLAGQSVVTYGTLKSSAGKPLGARTVYVQTATPDGWSTIATTTTKDDGYYRVYVRETGSFHVRTYAKAVGGDVAVASTPVQLSKVDGTQTLEQRYAQLKPWLKKATDSVRKITRNDVPIRYQRFEHGVLFEAKGRFYVVTGAVLKGYLSVNSVAGKLGRPLSDADCYVTVEKCIQPFAGGAVYNNTGSVTSRETHIEYGSGVGAELVAVAMSQVGYREPA